MKASENLAKIQEVLQSCIRDCSKFEEKGNFQASIRLRNGLSEIKNLSTETRALVKAERDSKK